MRGQILYQYLPAQLWSFLFSYLSGREVVIILNEKPLPLSHRHWHPDEDRFPA